MIASDHRFVPAAVFTHPQLATVGLTEAQRGAAGLRYVTASQAYGGTAYGWAMEDTTSVCKLIADPDTGQLLGAHLMGEQAATLIQPLIQAMSFGLGVREMARGPVLDPPGADRGRRERAAQPAALTAFPSGVVEESAGNVTTPWGRRGRGRLRRRRGRSASPGRRCTRWSPRTAGAPDRWRCRRPRARPRPRASMSSTRHIGTAVARSCPPLSPIIGTVSSTCQPSSMRPGVNRQPSTDP